jgi:hypothetical protein
MGEELITYETYETIKLKTRIILTTCGMFFVSMSATNIVVFPYQLQIGAIFILIPMLIRAYDFISIFKGASRSV